MKKKEPWRIIVFILAIMYIIGMWIKKDIVQIYTTMPQEQIIPMIATTIVVTLTKIILLTFVILLIKKIIEKFKKK